MNHNALGEENHAILGARPDTNMPSQESQWWSLNGQLLGGNTSAAFVFGDHSAQHYNTLHLVVRIIIIMLATQYPPSSAIQWFAGLHY